MHIKKNKPHAFSLVELSVVITVISLVLVAILSNTVSDIDTFKVRSTNDRITIINKALENFVAKNKRLPCPAAINLPRTDANYGNEGDCTANSGIFVAGTKVYGMVPTKALNLSVATAADGFGNKFAYIVDSSFKAASPNPFYEASVGLISIKSYNGTLTDVNPNAVFAIISYGANGNYAYGANSTTVNNSTSTDIYEQQNSPANLSTYLINSSSTAPAFDDIVFYKDKNNFLLDAKASTLQNSNFSGEAKNLNLGCTFSAGNTKTGITTSTTVSSTATSTQQFCNDTNFNTADFINYTCINGTISVISGACDTCSGTNTFVNNTCQPQCTWSGSNAINGILTTDAAVNATNSATKTCTGSNFNDSVTYSCLNGTISLTGGTSCDVCASGYSYVSGNCLPKLSCTGGSVVGSRRIHTFTASGTLTCVSGSTTNSLDILVVGGGGSGGDGSGAGAGGGGGGGGQVLQSLNNSVTISGSSNFSITVGGGGTTTNQVGGNSSISGNGLSLTASGGGGGGYYNGSAIAPSNGGGGGGGGLGKGAGGTVISQAGGAGNYVGGSGFGNSSIATAGGGGSTQAAGSNASTTTAGKGANGVLSSVSGASVTYGAGGGGGGPNTITRGTGGSSCGGNGAWSGTAATSATCYGGGGGGGSGSSNASGNGMGGIVIVSYPN